MPVLKGMYCWLEVAATADHVVPSSSMAGDQSRGGYRFHNGERAKGTVRFRCLPVFPGHTPSLSVFPQATITTICCNPATLFLLLAYLPCPCPLSSSSCSLPVPDFQSLCLYPPLLLLCSHSVCFLVHRLLTTPNLLSYPPASAFLSTAITSRPHTTSILSSSTSLRHPLDLLHTLLPSSLFLIHLDDAKSSQVTSSVFALHANLSH